MIIDSRLILECVANASHNARIPDALWTQIHREVLQSNSYEKLLGMREWIFHDAQAFFPMLEYCRRQVKEIIHSAMLLAASTSAGASRFVKPAKIAINLFKRLVRIFREHLSFQEVCNIVSIKQKESNGYETVALKVSHACVTDAVELDLEKHLWKSCFDFFQDLARTILEENGYRTEYYSFSLIPFVDECDGMGMRIPMTGCGAKLWEQESLLPCDLYLCMRIGSIDDTKEGDIRLPAHVNPYTVSQDFTLLGFSI